MNKYEESLQNLTRLEQYYQQNEGSRNEATTRLHLVDRIIKECLGWELSDITCEDSYDAQYCDYTLYAPRRIIIVEAKKESNYFDLPAGINGTIFSIRSLMRDYPSLRDAIRQVSSYCMERGVPIAVICNGHQLVAFVANRNDGVAPLEGNALVLSSFEKMRTHFLKLWNMLSHDGIETRNIFRELIGDTAQDLPLKLSSRIMGYPGNRIRNIFQTDMQIVSELVLEDLVAAHELEKLFLKDCYCHSGALSQHALISKNILQARYSLLFDDPGSPHLAQATKKDGSLNIDIDLMSRRPILLIGDVGVGKSTFIRNLITVEAESVFRDAITIHLDLGYNATMTTSIEDFIIEKTYSTLLENYATDITEEKFVRGVYHFDLERFRNGIYGSLLTSNPPLFAEKEIDFLSEKLRNKESHLKNALHHISKARRKQIVLFVDNCDQRSYDTQQKAFLMSQQIANEWNVTVFVSLRPETFHHSVREGALSGYHAKAFTISPPRIDAVILKRLEFALRIVSGEVRISHFGDGVGINLKSLESMIKVMLFSLRNNDELIELIDNLSSGNVRLALDLLKWFLGSGHVDTEKIKKIYDETGLYLVPIHEFLKAIIYVDYQHYDPGRSIFCNMFDIGSTDIKEHFLIYVLLASLETLSESSEKGGFVDTKSIYDLLQGYGYLPEQIDRAIISTCRKKLVETSYRQTPDSQRDIPRALRCTTIGLYHYHILSRQFVYIDAMIVDTPILIPTYRDKMHDCYMISDRLSRALIFCDYLTECLASLHVQRFASEISENINFLRSDIERIVRINQRFQH